MRRAPILFSRAVAKTSSISSALLAVSTVAASPSAAAADLACCLFGAAFGFFGLSNRPIEMTSGTRSCSSCSRFSVSGLNQERHAGQIAPRPIEALHQAESHRVDPDPEHDRHPRRGRFGGDCGGQARGHDEIDVLRDEFGGKRWRPAVIAAAGAVFDDDVPAFEETALSEALAPGGDPGGRRARRVGSEIADHWHRFFCARAATGAATAAPPRTARRSRRLIRCPRRQGRVGRAARSDSALSPSSG